MKIKGIMLAVAALAGLAVSAPSQVQIRARIGNHLQIGASFGPRVFHTPRAPYGHYETITERVWIDGCYHEEYVPAQYGWIVDSCGRRVWAEIAPACTRAVWLPGHFEMVQRRVWVTC